MTGEPLDGQGFATQGLKKHYTPRSIQILAARSTEQTHHRAAPACRGCEGPRTSSYPICATCRERKSA